MRKNAFKVTALSAVLVIVLLFCASCHLLPTILGGTPCDHSRVSGGSCIEIPTCLDCGESVGTYLAHDYETRVVAPKCDEDGYTESVCKVCNDTKRTDIVPTTGHSFGAWEIVVEPTDSQAGEMRRLCSLCTLAETKTIDPHTHSFEVVPAKAATCTEDGWEAYERCTECDYDTKIVIKATGHAWGEYISGGDGTHTRTCANDPSHKVTAPCSGGTSSGGSLPICEYCNGEYEFAARPGNSTYGYYALGEYASGEGMQKLYKDITAASEEFFFNRNDLEAEDGYYIIGEFDINDYSITIDEGMAVWKVFYVSSPAYYWLDSSIVTRGDSLLLTVSDLYAEADERRKCDAAIEKMVSDCSALIKSDMSDIERAMAIVSYIVTNMEYAYEADGVTPVDAMWAHNMTGLAVYNYGVCEAYAKSFTYLSLLNGVECAIGSGYAGGEAHAWNYVKLGGEWYGADITWTDNSGDEVVFDKFGLSSSSIFSDHQPHSSTNFGVHFIYEAPELSDKDIELTALYKNGEKAGIYKSIDEAFAAMTDTEAEYEIQIGFYSSFVGAITHTIRVPETPNVKKLTITGKNVAVGEGYLDNNSIINLDLSLTMRSDLVLKNVDVDITDKSKECKINLTSYTLTLAGKSVYLEPRVSGDDLDCKVVVDTEGDVYFFGGASITRLTVPALSVSKIVFGADSHMKYGPRPNNKIYTQNGADVAIDNYV